MSEISEMISFIQADPDFAVAYHNNWQTKY